MVTVPSLAAALQTLFTATADRIGRACGFQVRRSKISPAAFVRALVFGWIDDPRSPLDALAARLGVTAEALRQRCGRSAENLLRGLLNESLGLAFAARAAGVGLLKRFPAVVAEDATTLRLPRDLAGRFPASGGRRDGDNAAGLKVLTRWDLRTGKLLHFSDHPARDNDARLAARAGALPRGSLHLADLGFFDAARRRELVAAGCHFITRVPANVVVRVGSDWQPLADWLAGLPSGGYDGPARVVESDPLDCRLVARRCPDAVAAERKRRLRADCKRRGRGEPSRRRLAACEWLVLATDLSAQAFAPAGLWTLYRCRWQVELLFRRCKQRLGLSFSHGRSGARVLTEVLAKLLGAVVVLGCSLLRGGPLGGVGHDRLFRVARQSARALEEAIAAATGRGAVAAVLERLLRALKCVPRQSRRKKPTTRQLLKQPAFAD